jgi:hypothetical protein
LNSDVLGGKLFLNRWELMKRMGFHAFRRFRKTRLHRERCQENANNFWINSQRTLSEHYSRMDLQKRCSLQCNQVPRNDSLLAGNRSISSTQNQFLVRWNRGSGQDELECAKE